MSASSARQSQRVLIDAPVRLTLREASRTLPARGLDLSEGGIRLSADAPLGVGDEVTCSLELDNERAALQGRVRWSKPSTVPAGAMGFGVQFETLDEAQRSQLRRWLAHNSEHAEVVLLYVPSLREPLRARGCVTADGLQLTAALPQLAPGAELEFQLGDTGSRRLGRIERIDVKPRTEHGALELSVRLQPSAAARSRRNLVYGLGEFESVEYGPTAPRPAPPPPAAIPSPAVVIDTTGTSLTTKTIDSIMSTRRNRRRARTQTLHVPKTRVLRLLRWGVGMAAVGCAVLSVWSLAVTPSSESDEAALDNPPSSGQAALDNTAPSTPTTSISAATSSARARQAPAQPLAATPLHDNQPLPATARDDAAGSVAPQPRAATPTAAPQDLATKPPIPSNALPGTEESRLPALNAEGAKSEIFVPMQGSLDGLRTTQWTDPLAVVLELPDAHFAAPELLKGLRGGGVKRVHLDETRAVPRLQIFLNTVAARFAAKAVPHGLLVVLEHDLRPMPH